jgi:hypothetical protein
MKIPYSEKLKDPRWQKKRLEMMEFYNFSCSLCGEESRTLHIHHTLYKRGFDPWDYDETSLICLCDVCHKQVHEDKERIDELIAGNFNVNSIENIKQIIGYLLGLEMSSCPLDVTVKNEGEALGIADCWGVDPREVWSIIQKEKVLFAMKIFIESGKKKCEVEA